MDPAPPLGPPMMATKARQHEKETRKHETCWNSLSCFRVFVAWLVAVCVLAVASVPSEAAGDRYALIVTGASGGAQYAKTYETWRASLITTLRDRFAYPQDHIVVLSED